MDKELQAKWVAALRSGQYRQAKGTLKTEDGLMCCLGVLCAIQGVNWRERFPLENDLKTSCLPDSLSAGLDNDDMALLADKNDDGVSFEGIATYIEKTL